MKKVFSLIFAISLSAVTATADSLNIKTDTATKQVCNKKVLSASADTLKRTKTDIVRKDTVSLSNDTLTLSNDTILSMPKYNQTIIIENDSWYDKIFDVIVSLLLVIAGVAIEKASAYISRRRSINKLGHRCEVLFINLKSNLIAQTEDFKKFKDSYLDKDNAFKIPNIQKYDFLNCTDFEQFGKDNIYDYFTSKDKNNGEKQYKTFYGITYITKETYKQMFREFEKFLNKSSELMNKFNDSLRRFLHELECNYKLYEECLSEDYKEFTSKCEEMASLMPNLNLFEKKAEIFDFLIHIIVKHDTSRCANILTPLMEIEDYIQEMKNEKTYCKIHMDATIERFNEMIEKINKFEKES